jgi:cytosine/adenosine deaminase-related metal-dependent hydrolase
MIKLKANYVITMNKKNEIIENGEVIFDKKIIKVGKDLEKNIKTIDLGKDSILMPGLINTHTHLEFSANQTTLKYGDFISWLNSVIAKRENLLQDCREYCYKKAIKQMKKSGITAFGEISSTAIDLEQLVDSDLKVVYFNEIIGSNPAAVDALYQDFLSRLNESEKYKSEKFIPSISIHSPYSVHPIVIKNVLKIAKEKNMIVSTHFMESKAEREWLDNNKGDFKLFFKQNLNQEKAITSSMEFLEQFEDVKTHFIHCVNANEEELQKISSMNASIAHCPISNRLLNVGLLDIERVKNLQIPYSVATDGLSSNYSLNLFKEMRAALLMHIGLHPKYLAKDLIKSVTKNAGNILGLNNGSIEVGKFADLISFKLAKCNNIEDLYLQIILQTNEIEKMWINGEAISLYE